MGRTDRRNCLCQNVLNIIPIVDINQTVKHNRGNLDVFKKRDGTDRTGLDGRDRPARTGRKLLISFLESLYIIPQPRDNSET